ncbi:MAG: hypothetical protein H6870_14780 [Methylobacteriaceae bacterium]|nr:hypothetical protein [Methylobacteriaceae bacterium]
MTDKPEAGSNFPQLAPMGSALAPIIYFDAAPNYGFNAGVANITLETMIHIASGDGLTSLRQIVAHLRMNAIGLAALKEAINQIELLAQPVESKAAH